MREDKKPDAGAVIGCFVGFDLYSIVVLEPKWKSVYDLNSFPRFFWTLPFLRIPHKSFRYPEATILRGLILDSKKSYLDVLKVAVGKGDPTARPIASSDFPAENSSVCTVICRFLRHGCLPHNRLNVRDHENEHQADHARGSHFLF